MFKVNESQLDDNAPQDILFYSTYFILNQWFSTRGGEFLLYVGGVILKLQKETADSTGWNINLSSLKHLSLESGNDDPKYRCMEKKRLRTIVLNYRVNALSMFSLGQQYYQ